MRASPSDIRTAATLAAWRAVGSEPPPSKPEDQQPPKTVVRSAADAAIRQAAAARAEELLQRARREEQDDAAENRQTNAAWELERDKVLYRVPKPRTDEQRDRERERRREQRAAQAGTGNVPRSEIVPGPGISEIVESSTGAKNAPGHSTIGTLRIRNWKDNKVEDPNVFEDNLARALMEATGHDVQMNGTKGVLDTRSSDSLMREPKLVEGGKVVYPDFVRVSAGVVEVFEATLNSDLLDPRRTFPQKLEQLATAVPALTRAYPGFRIIYSIVTPRAITEEIRKMITEELTLPGRTTLPVQLIWRQVPRKRG